MSEEDLRDWNSGLCHCFSSGVVNCLLGFCLYGVLVGLNSHNMGESFFLCCCPGAGHHQIRSKIRAEQKIDGSLLKDCLTVTLCPPCAAIQESNEINRFYNQDTDALIVEAKL